MIRTLPLRRAIVCASLCAVSLAGLSQPSAPRPAAPLVPFRSPRMECRRAALRQREDATRRPAPRHVSRRAAPRRAETAAGCRPVSWDVTLNDGPTARYGATYDEYGRVTSIESAEGWERFTYRGDLNGEWLMRASGMAGERDTVWRAFDQRERLTSLTRASWDMWGGLLQRQTTYYGYDHNPEGEETGFDEYDRDETGAVRLSNWERGVWFEPVGQWLWSRGGDTQRSVYVVAGDGLSYAMLQQEMDSCGWVTTDKEAQFFSEQGKNEASYHVSYDTDGRVSYAFGDSIRVERATPREGWTTLTRYRWDSDEDYDYTLTPERRFVRTDGYDAPHLPGDAPRREAEYRYDHDDGSGWQLTYDTSHEWVRRNILKTTEVSLYYGYGDEPERDTCEWYRLYSPQGEELGEVYFHGDGYVVERRDEGDTLYYDYYDRSDALTLRLRRSEETLGRNGARRYERWDGDSWAAVTDRIETESDGEWTVMTLNADGYVTRRDCGETGEERPFASEVYTYTPQGYTYELYELGDADTLALFRRDRVMLVDGDTLRQETVEFAESGAVRYARRADDCQQSGLHISYSWDGATACFRPSYYYVTNKTYTTPDGWEVRIERVYEDGAVVNRGKTEYRRLDGADGAEYVTYVWDTAAGQWLPERKTAYRDGGGRPDFPCVYPQDPVEALREGWEECVPQGNAASALHRTLDYEAVWNTDLGAWDVLRDFSVEWTVDGLTLTTTRRDDGSTYVETLITDSRHRLVTSRWEVWTDGGPTTEKGRREYTYDGQGNLKAAYDEHSYMKGDGAWKRTTSLTEYRYTSDAVTGLATLRPDSGAPVVEGRVVRGREGETLVVTDAAGRLVARGADSVTLPGAGVYVVTGGGRSLKVSVR